MNDRPTIQAPAAEHEPRTRTQLAMVRFGTIGFDLYRAAVLAESERLFKTRKEPDQC